jgi:hypothetical protein
MSNPKSVIGTTLGDIYAGSSNQKVFDGKGRLYQNSSDPVFTTDGVLYQGGKAVFTTGGRIDTYLANYIENLSASTGFVLSPSSMTAYGVSVIGPTSAIPTSGVGRAYLAPPITGVEKIIILKSTAAGWIIDIDVTTNIGIAGTTGTFIGFSSLGTKYQSITLIGLSTTMWGVTAVNSTVGGFDTTNGIRQLTAVRTS